jgi:tetratricopeptide (TPR) repeat protein
MSWLWLAIALASVFLAAMPAQAGEEPEHYHLVYTLARTVGFNDADARLVATASWSVDLNPDTTAYDEQRRDIQKVSKFLSDIAFTDVPDERQVQALFQGDGLLSHAPKGIAYHALGSEPARRVLDLYWQQQVREAGTRSREERLIATGIYLHFVVDRYVHPADAIIGHAIQNKIGADPDWAVKNPLKFRSAAGDVFALLRKTAEEAGLSDTNRRRPDIDGRLRTLGLETADKRSLYYDGIVASLGRSYAANVVDAAAAARQLQTDFGPLFKKVGESFVIPSVEEGGDNKKYALRYSVDPSGALTISGPLLQGQPAKLADPVTAIRSTPVTDGLAVARRDLVDQARGYYSDTLIVAASLPTAGIRLNPIASNAAEAVVRRATEQFTATRQDVGTIYQRAEGAGVRVIQRAADGTVTVWQGAGGKLQRLEQKAGQQITASEVPLRMAASALTNQASVGGVRLDYGAGVLAALQERADGTETSLVRVDGPFRLVSLRTVLAAVKTSGGRLDAMDAAARTLGGISRIYGYLIEPASGDVILIGGMVPGAPALRADDLVTGLRQVYREGIVPMVSLDPDPTDVAAGQKIRLVGVPADSHFARVMVEADYEMKKIVFGASPIRAGTFRSSAELSLDQMDKGGSIDGHSRFWLTPVQPGPSDIQVSPGNQDGLFLGRVQLLTEALEMTSAGLQGTGTTDPASEETARLFSANFQAIATQRPILRALEGLNDVVLLATVLRKAQVRGQVLDELAGAALSVSEPPLPKSFPTIFFSQKRGDKAIGLVGGVNLRAVALKSKWARYRDWQIAQLYEAARRLVKSRQIALDPSMEYLVISPPRGKRSEVEVLLERGMAKHRAGQNKEAVDDFTRALDLDGRVVEARVGRAMANAALGNKHQAYYDARKALESDPQDEDIAAMKIAIGIESGIDLSAIFDANVSQSVRSRVANLFVKRGVARAARQRADAAEQDFTNALLIDPKNTEALMLRGTLRVERAAAGNGTAVFDQFAALAFDDLNRALQLDSSLGTAYTARSKLKTLSYDFEGAIADASAAIRLDPKDVVGYSHRGMAYAYARRLDEALADLGKAVELAPQDGRAYFNRGIVHMARKDKDKALAEFEKAIEFDPSLAVPVVEFMKSNRLSPKK